MTEYLYVLVVIISSAFGSAISYLRSVVTVFAIFLLTCMLLLVAHLYLGSDFTSDAS